MRTTKGRPSPDQRSDTGSISGAVSADGATVVSGHSEPGENLAIEATDVNGATEVSGRGGSRPEISAKQKLLLNPGAAVAQYEIIREIGKGGMGQVFLARDTKLGRKVALKVMRQVGSDRFTERFLLEARATARCNHENIVTIHEVNEHQGLPYMVLEYLDGAPLNKLLASQHLTAARAVDLAIPVVRALERAHGLDIVHRDLKPENIFVTRAGIVKVLDFGIAKLYTPDDTADPKATLPPITDLASHGLTARETAAGTLVGTTYYMAPEQWGMGAVDRRTDLFTMGLILWEMVAGANPLTGLDPPALMKNAFHLDEPMPSVADAVPHLPGELERIIDRCLAKRPAGRFASATDLLDALLPLQPRWSGRPLREEEGPFPGLAAFQEADADRFFGRNRDITRTVARLREQPIVTVVGPSGVGKSSLIRAGVIPALKRSGEPWEVFVTRPGRSPLSALATLVQSATRTSAVDAAALQAEHAALVERLHTEPGHLGSLLRSRASQKSGSILLFVDQAEEIYTLVADPAERAAFTTCLTAVADDPAAPLRVVLSLRSDFLDRVAEDRVFLEELSRGLLFLRPPTRRGIEEALQVPVDLLGYAFESPELVGRMLSELDETHGALPLLQFAASRLWEKRDTRRRLLTTAAYEAMGGVAGALASHANEVLAGMGADAHELLRTVLLRLVTPEGTRAVVTVKELSELGPLLTDVQHVLDQLVGARLIVVQSRGAKEGPSVELVHESLITRWPTLSRWLDEDSENAALLEQIRLSARQWHDRGRPVGLLWRGEAVEDARRFRRRSAARLAPVERDFLDDALRQADRATRVRRIAVASAFAFLFVLIAAAVVALVTIQGARSEAQSHARRTQREAKRARAAEQETKRQLERVTAKERERLAAEAVAKAAQNREAAGARKLQTTEKKLGLTYDQLLESLRRIKAEKLRAERAAARERLAAARERLAAARERLAAARERLAAARARRLAAAEKRAKEQLAILLAREQARVRELQRQLDKIATELR